MNNRFWDDFHRICYLSTQDIQDNYDDVEDHKDVNDLDDVDNHDDVTELDDHKNIDDHNCINNHDDIALTILKTIMMTFDDSLLEAVPVSLDLLVLLESVAVAMNWLRL